MTFGSLFTGIGGLDLGLERAGMECRWQVEIDDYCTQILEKHWPEVKRYGDIREVAGSDLEAVDLICGGFPCQDLSAAGKRAGIEGARSGLWFEFARLVGELGPRWVLIENVPGLLVYGAMRRVIGELSRLGYVGSWRSLRAADFGASHLRKRVFIVAHRIGSDSERRGDAGIVGAPPTGESCQGIQRQRTGDTVDDSGDELGDAERSRWPPSGLGCDEHAGSESEARCGNVDDPGGSERWLHDERRRRAAEGIDAEGEAAGGSGEPGPGNVSDSVSARLEERRRERTDDAEERAAAERDRGTLPQFAPGPSDPRWPAILGERPDLAPALESPVRGVADGIPDWLHGVMQNRTKRLGRLGNAVVPQVAEWIGRRILEVA